VALLLEKYIKTEAIKLLVFSSDR
jgi:hypothetical protein